MNKESKPFIPYKSLERFGTNDTEYIELGECYVFPKIDGTNASLWISNGELQAGSRTRHLSLDKDNAGFLAWAKEQQYLLDYFKHYPNHRLFGEWLVPHSLKTYRSSAWRQFYVFDVAIETSDECRDNLQYLHYESYRLGLEDFGVNYVPALCRISNGAFDNFFAQLQKNTFLIEEGKGFGEGIVIKNYDYKNKYGRTPWAKIVTSEFKEKHLKTMGSPNVKGDKVLEIDIAKTFVTIGLIEKEYAKICIEGWSNKDIPRLLNTVFHSVIKDDCWEILKKHKMPVIDFKKLQHFVFNEIKIKKPELF